MPTLYFNTTGGIIIIVAVIIMIIIIIIIIIIIVTNHMLAYPFAMVLNPKLEKKTSSCTQDVNLS